MAPSLWNLEERPGHLEPGVSLRLGPCQSGEFQASHEIAGTPLEDVLKEQSLFGTACGLTAELLEVRDLWQRRKCSQASEAESIISYRW